ncbi:MAG TPA: cupredoxin domain-containing protein [Anaerolineales bacterium]|nr:cupredoxin domain-containing protein [Anaerolineales bacterium]
MPFSTSRSPSTPANHAAARPAAWAGFLSLALVVLLVPVPTGAASGERTIRIAASSYAYDPGVVSVNPGDRVTIELVAQDVVHGLYLDGYGIQLRADPGQTARLTFTASRPGTFRFRCSETCGPLHPFMIGRLSVGPNLTLLRWAGLGLLASVFGLWILRR